MQDSQCPNVDFSFTQSLYYKIKQSNEAGSVAMKKSRKNMKTLRFLM